MTKAAARHSRESSDWITPPHVVEAARQVMGALDLDPASDAEANMVVKATRYFTADDDGLLQPWAGRVFLNPPGGLVKAFWLTLLRGWMTDAIEQFIWVGYSLEQLQTLQQAKAYKTPLDFHTCITARRISFIENAAMQAARWAKIDAKNAILVQEGKKLKPKPFDADSPSHSNYITYGGCRLDHFCEVFSAFGQIVRPRR